jgi:flagellar hook-associated protein 2
MSTAAAPITFNGLSSYSSDFQAILNRQVSIAQLPLVQLQNQQANELQQKAALVALAPEVANLGTSIDTLSSLGSGQGLVATSSDSSVVTAVNTGDTSNASYSISNITSLAAPASETSLAGYANLTTAAVSSTGSVNLVYGVNTYNITLTPQTNNLNGLVTAINKLNVGVNASVITTGTGTTPDYLTLSASSSGQTTLQLQDVPAPGGPSAPPVNLISATNQGSNSAFDLNGLPVSTSSNVINGVIPGLTFTLLGTTSGSQTVQLSLAPDATGLSSALQNFAQSYNALATQVSGQVGTGAGALAGNSLVYELSSDLQQVSSYRPSGSGLGSIASLAELGLTFADGTGQITFDPSVVAGLSGTQLKDAFTFLGSATSGFGSLAGVFTQLGDPTAGLIVQQEASDDAQNTTLTDKINTLTTQIASFQANLTARLTTADEAVSELQNQLTSVNATLQGLDVVLYGKQVGANGI